MAAFRIDRTLFNESKGSPLELVAISRGRELLAKLQELYHVLWVEWAVGRHEKSSGWVERWFWEAQDLEPISLILE